jgi:hypothetical protein
LCPLKDMGTFPEWPCHLKNTDSPLLFCCCPLLMISHFSWRLGTYPKSFTWKQVPIPSAFICPNNLAMGQSSPLSVTLSTVHGIKVQTFDFKENQLLKVTTWG